MQKWQAKGAAVWDLQSLLDEAVEVPTKRVPRTVGTAPKSSRLAIEDADSSSLPLKVAARTLISDGAYGAGQEDKRSLGAQG